MMFLPKLNFSIVDVRDVAAAHIKAMTTQEASGKFLFCLFGWKRTVHFLKIWTLKITVTVLK